MGNSFRAAQPTGQAPQAPQPNRGSVGNQPINHGGKKSQPTKKVLIIVGIVALALLVALAGFYAIKQFNQIQPDDDSYQAVFLTNGQVYFGKLDNVNQDYLQLSGIYYLQAGDALQVDSSQSKAEKPAKDSDGMQLIKLGDELHGPKDMMQINDDQVLFWEDLKADGKVAEAITSYRSDK